MIYFINGGFGYTIKLHLLNILWFVLVIFASFNKSYSSILSSSDFLIIFLDFLFFLVFIYNFFYITIVNKSKPGINRWDFISNSGREKINQNIDDYFYKKDIIKYRIVSKMVYLFPLSFLIIIIVIFFFFLD